MKAEKFNFICNEYLISPNLVIEQMINTFLGQNNVPLKIADIISDEDKTREFIENNF
jgi:hypothetical protein